MNEDELQLKAFAMLWYIKAFFYKRIAEEHGVSDKDAIETIREMVKREDLQAEAQLLQGMMDILVNPKLTAHWQDNNEAIMAINTMVSEAYEHTVDSLQEADAIVNLLRGMTKKEEE